MKKRTAAPSALSLKDESDLAWYFARGKSSFERSTSGAMLEHLDADAYTSEECERCYAGIIHATGAWCPGCGGTGFTTIRRKSGPLGFGIRSGCVRCSACLGSGEGTDDDGQEISCHECAGAGYRLTGQNVFPTATVTAGRGYTPDDRALARYARISRILGNVEPKSLRIVLEAFYGDVGARWGRTRHGRLFAIYALTPAGHKLVRMATMGDSLEGLSPAERIGVQAELERSQPKAQRHALLDGCEKQARELYQTAADKWNSLKPPRRRVA